MKAWFFHIIDARTNNHRHKTKHHDMQSKITELNDFIMQYENHN